MNPDHLREAIALARKGMSSNAGGPFGAVIVRKNRVIGRGWNQVTSTNDPTAHAEIIAIRDACRTLGTWSLVGCELYSSCEPCPMCRATVYWARLDRVYYGATSDDAAAAGFDDRRICQELAKAPGSRSVPMNCFLRDEALEVFRDWRSKPDRVPY